MRSALLTPVNLGTIWVFEDKAREHWERKDAAVLERRDILFGSLVQCGVSQFECLAIPDSYMPTAEVLRRRMVTKQDNYGTCLSIVHGSFEKHLGKNFCLHPQPDKINTLFLMVGDILYALHRRKNMVCFFDLDEFLPIIETLPPEVAVPLRNLWSLMSRSEPGLPVPQYEISTDDAIHFEQIIASNLFTQYETQSERLDIASSAEDASLKKIQNAAVELVNANQRFLKLRNTPMRLLTLTAKAIDAVFGKLPGTLADFAVKEAHQFLGADKRLVIYSARTLLLQTQAPSFVELQQQIKARASKQTEGGIE